MKLTLIKPSQVLMAAPLLVVMAGCQSGFFKKPEINLNKLAFWKSGDVRLASKSDIPPPSTHFSPVETEQAKSQSDGKIKNSLDQLVAESKTTKQEMDPIRKPYSLDSIEPKLSANQPPSAAGPVEQLINEKLNQFQASTNQVLNSAEDMVDKTGQMIDGAEHSIAGWKNSVHSDGQERLANVSNHLNHQTDQSLAVTTSSLNSMATAAENGIQKSVAAATESLDNSFQAVSAQLSAINSIAESPPPITDISQDPATAENDFAGFTGNRATTDSQPTYSATNTQSSATVITSPIQKSSYDAPNSGASAMALQPMQPIPSNIPATQYPTTSFGVIQPNDVQTSVAQEDEFVIPQHLLRGSGTYFPGSTKPLRPLQ